MNRRTGMLLESSGELWPIGGVVAVLMLSMGTSRGVDPRPIEPGEFRSLHQMIKVQPGESRFLEIPWLLDTWEARKVAAAEGKPILVWAGSQGAPIAGC